MIKCPQCKIHRDIATIQYFFLFLICRTSEQASATLCYNHTSRNCNPNIAGEMIARVPNEVSLTTHTFIGMTSLQL